MKTSAAERQDSVEITPEMVQTGADILWGFDREYDDAREYATRVYRAMESARFASTRR